MLCQVTLELVVAVDLGSPGSVDGDLLVLRWT
jgi:hypothetical protein